MILDLDETLVHASDTELGTPAHFRAASYYVYKRPHLDEFIGEVCARYKVAIWTASGQTYAEQVLSQLSLTTPPLEFIWCADRCTQRFDHETRDRDTVKRLSKVRKRGYDLDRVLVIDDSPEKHVLNYGNLIHILPFLGDPTDVELPRVASYLKELAGEPNVRKIEKRGWNLRDRAGI